MLGQCLCQWHSRGERKRVEGSVEVREWREIKMREKERIKGTENLREKIEIVAGDCKF
jgi:hypothetical protein